MMNLRSAFLALALFGSCATADYAFCQGIVNDPDSFSCSSWLNAPGHTCGTTWSQACGAHGFDNPFGSEFNHYSVYDSCFCPDECGADESACGDEDWDDDWTTGDDDSMSGDCPGKEDALGLCMMMALFSDMDDAMWAGGDDVNLDVNPSQACDMYDSVFDCYHQVGCMSAEMMVACTWVKQYGSPDDGIPPCPNLNCDGEEDEPEDDEGLSQGALVGIIVGSVVGGGLLIALGTYLLCKKSSSPPLGGAAAPTATVMVVQAGGTVAPPAGIATVVAAPITAPPTGPPKGSKFDPNTGAPIPKFDPNTGKQNW